jgi:Lar family restriction alleviation protein
MIELRECPFCGSKSVELVENIWADPIGVWCRSCGVVVELPKTKTRTPETIIRAWNRRDDDADAPD